MGHKTFTVAKCFYYGYGEGTTFLFRVTSPGEKNILFSVSGPNPPSDSTKKDYNLLKTEERFETLKKSKKAQGISKDDFGPNFRQRVTSIVQKISGDNKAEVDF